MANMFQANFNGMQRYPGYPTPPSDDSPLSGHPLSSPSYSSDNSSSPIHFSKANLPTNFTIENYNTYMKKAAVQEIPPCLRIVEQPIDKFRFRYKSEMTGTHGSLNGENSDKTRKMTFPTVELRNYPGTAVIRCSIWQINHNNNDFMPHAHRLVKKNQGREEADDPHDLFVNKESNYQATFHTMGIIHTARKNIVAELIKKKTKLKKEAAARKGRLELTIKEEMEIKGLAEAESKSINLNVVCLRFDAFFVGSDDVYFPICPPVFTHAINNLKSALTGELKIVRMDHCTSPASGGREIFLLVERVTKKNVKVRFYELDDEDNTTWEDYGRFNDLDVHHQYAIVLKTPPYKKKDINTQVNVYMELIRPSDNARSESKTFTYTSSNFNDRPGVKRPRNEYDSFDYDTSSICSEILPTTLQSINSEFDIMQLAEPSIMMNSEELKKAIEDMDSEEFEKLYKLAEPEYTAANANFSVDFPSNPLFRRRKMLTSNTSRPFKINKEYEDKVKRVHKEISEFLKSAPPFPKIKKVLQHYLANPDEELNAFHMAVMINDQKAIKFFIKLIFFAQELNLVNMLSHKYGTVLHLATLCNNVELIERLVSDCGALLSKRDANENTPLHIAVMKDYDGQIMKALLKAQDVSECIDCQNRENDSALHLAIKKRNLMAIQLLYKHGADIDLRHDCNGFTPLRFAVENGDTRIVDFILNRTNVNPKVRDFAEIDPLQVVLNNQCTPDVRALVEKYIFENNITCDEISVKEEPEDQLSGDELIINEEDVKSEPSVIIEDLSPFYQNLTSFTDECLEEVSNELDSSGKLNDLAVLLDVEHLIETFDEQKSQSKQLLTYVVASNSGSIKEIRDFLENLDERKAVQAIDRMVQEYVCSNRLH